MSCWFCDIKKTLASSFFTQKAEKSIFHVPFVITPAILPQLYSVNFIPWIFSAQGIAIRASNVIFLLQRFSADTRLMHIVFFLSEGCKSRDTVKNIALI